jgi:hypothetical protein
MTTQDPTMSRHIAVVCGAVFMMACVSVAAAADAAFFAPATPAK